MNATPDDPADAEALAGYAQALVECIETELVDWLISLVRSRAATDGTETWNKIAETTEQVAAEASIEVMADIKELLATDVDQQVRGPLEILRSAVRYPTQILREAGVAPTERDDWDSRVFPEDIYGLSPANFGDISEKLQSAGISWGAAKAHVVLARRRSGFV